jgi:hypothetical protein
MTRPPGNSNLNRLMVLRLATASTHLNLICMSPSALCPRTYYYYHSRVYETINRVTPAFGFASAEVQFCRSVYNLNLSWDSTTIIRVFEVLAPGQL